MATLSDTNRIAIVSETTPGTTPTPTAAFEILRLLSESVTSTNNNVDSGELDPARGLTDTIKTSADIGGNVESYCVYNGTWVEVIKSIVGQSVTWPSSNSTTVVQQGFIKETFTFERTIDNILGRQSYARYKGLSFSSVNFSFAPNDPLTMSFGVMGGEMTLAEDAAVTGDAELGSSYSGPLFLGGLPMTGDQVGLTWTAPSAAALATALNDSVITAMTLNIDSQNREIEEIGATGSDVVLGKMAINISFTSLFRGNAIKEGEVNNHLLANNPSLSVVLTDSAAKSYTFDFPRVKILQANAITPTTNADVVYEVEAVALVDVSGVLIEFTATE
jgi:hypothetical protein